jgi:hypothetical protein
MVLGSLAAIYHSLVCPDALRKDILSDLRRRKIVGKNAEPEPVTIYPSLSKVNVAAFADVVAEHSCASTLGLPAPAGTTQTGKARSARGPKASKAAKVAACGATKK